MRKHLGTILGIVLTLGAAFGAYAWDNDRRSESALRRAHALADRCFAERRAATGAPVTQDFPECAEPYRASIAAHGERVRASMLFGGAVGLGFALIFFGVRWYRRL